MHVCKCINSVDILTLMLRLSVPVDFLSPVRVNCFSRRDLQHLGPTVLLSCIYISKLNSA